MFILFGAGLYTVVYIRHETNTQRQERQVNLQENTCTCLKFQDMQLPCVHAVAVLMKCFANYTQFDIVQKHAHPSYLVVPNMTAGIIMQSVSPPSDDDLFKIKDAGPAVRSFLNRNFGSFEHDDICKAPVEREATHGNKSHKRKQKNPHVGRGSSGARTRGHTNSRSYAISKEAKVVAQHTCKACNRAGRKAPDYDVRDHVSKTCPYEVKLAKVVELFLSSDEEN